MKVNLPFISISSTCSSEFSSIPMPNIIFSPVMLRTVKLYKKAFFKSVPAVRQQHGVETFPEPEFLYQVGIRWAFWYSNVFRRRTVCKTMPNICQGTSRHLHLLWSARIQLSDYVLAISLIRSPQILCLYHTKPIFVGLKYTKTM